MKSSAVYGSLRLGRNLLVGAMCALIIFAGSGGRHIASAISVACPGPVTVVNATTGATTCFTTIQEGVTFASPADTVIVAPGTYTENVTIPIVKHDITVRSSGGAQATTIVGTITNASTLNAVVNILANGVTFGGPGMGFTVENSPTTALTQATDVRGIAVGGGAGADNVRVLDNIVTNLVPSSVQIITTASLATTGKVMGISATRSQNVLISGNTVASISFVAVSAVGNLTGFGIQLLSIPFLAAHPNSGAIDGNSVHDLNESGGACPGTVLIGIAINDNSMNTFAAHNTVSHDTSSCRSVGIGSSAVPGPIVITHNTVDRMIGGASSEGAGLKPGANPNFPGTATETVMTNDFNSLLKAVAVGSPLGTNSAIEYNNFRNDTYGIDNGGDPALNATNNWWNCSGGPFGGTFCATITNSGAGVTKYHPYLPVPVNTIGGASGPPGPGACLVKVTNATTGATSCHTTIQAGVIAANPFDTVTVAAGTYNENVTIPAIKHDITVQSQFNAPSVTIVGKITVAGAPPGNAVVTILASGVTFGGLGHGFQVRNGSSTVAGQVTAVAGIQVGTGSTAVSHDRVIADWANDLVPAGKSVTRTAGISASGAPDHLITDNIVGPASFGTTAPGPVFGFGIIVGNTTVSILNNGLITKNTVYDLHESGGNCTLQATVLVGIAVNDFTGTESVNHNNVHDLSAGCRAIALGSSAEPGPITWHQNRLTYIHGAASEGTCPGAFPGCKNLSFGMGLRPGANPSFPGTATETVMTNELYSVGNAIAIDNPLGTNTAMEYNNFDQDLSGIDNDGDPGLNATNNYWGCALGPFGGAGCAQLIGAATTLYQPFLTAPVAVNSN